MDMSGSGTLWHISPTQTKELATEIYIQLKLEDSGGTQIQTTFLSGFNKAKK